MGLFLPVIVFLSLIATLTSSMAMVVVRHLTSPASLPSTTGSDSSSRLQLSVASYNVLLPNSVDGWWTYKMYDPPLQDKHYKIASWEYRRSLLKERIQTMNADIVCFQEVSPQSFESDFAFMSQELGYDGKEMFKRGRFRPATFWKTSKCQLAAAPVHKDRTLLTAFVLNDDDGSEAAASTSDDDDPHWYVVNCHLQSAGEAARRLRQIQDGTKAVVTLSRKLQPPKKGTKNKKNAPAIADSTKVKLIVCGDFNGDGVDDCAAIRFCEHGYVDETFLEDGVAVTSTKRALPLTETLIDTMTTVPRHGGQPPPATMVVPERINVMVKEGTKQLSDNVVERLTRIYKRLATDQGVMTKTEVDAWLERINRIPTRGSEFREAAMLMGYKPPPEEEALSQDELKKLVVIPEDGILTLHGFLRVYQKELYQGKFWGIAHDLAVLGEPLPADGQTFQGRLDHMYHTPALQPIAVLDTICEEACPNAKEPSDHLPVAAAFTIATNRPNS